MKTTRLWNLTYLNIEMQKSGKKAYKSYPAERVITSTINQPIESPWTL